MKIKKVCKLNEKLKMEIRELEEECKKTDHTRSMVSFDMDIEEGNICNYFYLTYQERKLIGCLFLFFIGEKLVEICAFVHPNFRRKGIFKNMYANALLELNKMGSYEIILIHEPISQAGALVLKSISATFLHSEYLMSYGLIGQWKESKLNRKSNKITIKSHEDMYLEKAVEEDIPRLREIYLQLFHNLSKDEVNYHFIEIIENKNCDLYKAMLKGVMIGFCSVIKEETYQLIFDFAIAREYQRKGRGKEFLTQVIEKLINDTFTFKERKIILHVSSDNEPAYHLYRNFGFEVIEQYDYYKVS